MDTTTKLETDCKKILVSDATDTVFCDSPEETRKFPWFLYFSGFTSTLLLSSTGFVVVWFSSALPQLQSNNTDINPLGTPITVTQISTMSMTLPISSPISLILTAKICDKFGRKAALRILGIIFVCNQIVWAFATHIYLYYICNFISGFTFSGLVVCVPIYNNEIAEERNRGKIGGLTGLGMPTGELLSYAIGPLIPLKYFMLVCGFPALLHLIFSTLILDTPPYLALKGKKLEAFTVLEKLRRTNNMKYLDNEYEKLKNFAHTSRFQKRNFIQIFTNRAPRKAFILSILIVGVQQLSGIFCILSFMAPIFNEARTTLSGNTVAIIVGTVQLVIFLIATGLTDKIGRKPLLISSALVSGISLLALAIYFYLKSINSEIIDTISWLPVFAVLLYIIGYSLGLGPIPLAMLSELFPNDLRAKGVAAIIIIDNATISLTLITFPLVSAYFGVHYCMSFFSFICLLGSVLMYIFLPETKGKSFVEIQDILNK